MTEADMMTKDCPFFRHCINEHGVIADGDSPIYASDRCRGSACLMYREKIVVNGNTGSRQVTAYCGVAGRPE